MLQLLLEGGQRYDDIGSLLGISADEVRTRARAALQEIGGADPDAQVALSDYLLGQADPIGRADAVRHLQNDPEDNALAERLQQNLRLLAPKAELPAIPEPRGGRRGTPPPPPADPAQAAPTSAGAPPATPAAPGGAAAPRGPGFASRVSGVFSGLSGRRRTQFAVGLAAALALIVVVVVVATSGGSGGGSDCASVNPTQTSLANASLDAVGASAEKDCQPSGVVSLVPVGQTKNGQPQLAGFAFEMKAANLEPTSGSDVYVLWLEAGNGQARALGRQTVDDSGNLTGDAALTSTDLALLQSGSFKLSRVTQAQQQQIQQQLQSQGKRPTGLVSFVGTPVLQGSASSMVQQLQTVLQQLQQQQQQSGASGGQGQSGGGAQPNPNQGAGKNG